MTTNVFSKGKELLIPGTTGDDVIGSGRPIYRHRPLSFSVWPMHLRRDLYFDGTESASA